MSWRSNIILVMIINHYVILTVSLIAWTLTIYLDFHIGIMLFSYILLIALLSLAISDSSSSIIINRILITFVMYTSMILLLYKINSIENIYENKPDIKLESYSLFADVNDKLNLNIINAETKYEIASFKLTSEDIVNLNNPSAIIKVVNKNYWYLEAPENEYSIKIARESND